MAAATRKARVAVSYDDSHSDTSVSDAELNEEEGVSSSLAIPKEEIDGSDADISGSEDDQPDAGSGMANVMAKILGKQTKTANVVLAKAKTDRQIQYIKREKVLKEEDDAPRKKRKTGEEEDFIKDRRNFAQEREMLEKKKRWEEMGRVRPSALEKDFERKLKRIATQGVVQLFNAVKTQQKVIENRLKEVGSSEVKREKVLKSIKKGDFLDMLKPTTPNIAGDPKQMMTKKRPKEELESDEETEGQSNQPGWKILRDDFMMGGTMKDWDKESDDELSNNDEVHDDSSEDDDS